MNMLTVNVAIENTAEVSKFVEQQLKNLGISVKILRQIMIAVDEIYSNITSYSRATQVTVSVSLEGNDVKLQFLDDGVAYNPLKNVDPDTTLSLKERNIGGLGIFLVKKSMDSMDYQFTDGRNILTLRKKYND